MEKVVSAEKSKGEQLSDTCLNIRKADNSTSDTSWISTEDDLNTADDSQESSAEYNTIEEIIDGVKGESTDVEAFEDILEEEENIEVESTEVAAFDGETTTTEVVAIGEDDEEDEEDEDEEIDAVQLEEKTTTATAEEKEPIETTEIIQISESEHDAAQAEMEESTENVAAEPEQITVINKISGVSAIQKGLKKTGLLEVLKDDQLSGKEGALDVSDEELSEDEEKKDSDEEILPALQGKGDEKRSEQSLDENINEILAATDGSSLQLFSESQQQQVKAYDINQDISSILDDTSELTIQPNTI